MKVRMLIYRHIRTALVLSLSLFLGNIVFAQYDHLLPESSYPYWPEYEFLRFEDLDTIEAQQWIDHNHIINGWDWSIPEFVEPSPRSLVGLQRNIGENIEFKPLDLKFKSNSIGILWVKWRDIEKTPGNFDFTPIINRINQANSVGSDIILRILGHSKSRDGNINKGEAPLWLEDLGVNFLPQENPSHNLNFDPSHPVFHEHYLRLVNSLAATEIPDMVKAAYVGYASHSFGDEGIGPYGEGNPVANDTVQHVRERLDAWQNAFLGMEYKIFMGGPVDYGFRKGFGVRRGFVEMYWYHVPDDLMGQLVDPEGYLYVDESAPIINYECFNGEVNEEYEPAWATPERSYRFGATTNSFPYRYFVSNLRVLQMRCTYVHTTGHLIPKMLPFISQQLGRTVEDTPDAWSFLITSNLKSGETKHFERWLYQRDEQGYETQPAVKMQHVRKMWMIEPDMHYDYIARQGKRMGFDVDDRLFPDGEQPMAIKVSFLDSVAGTIKLKYQTNSGVKVDSVVTTGQNEIRTATFFITARMDDTGFDHNYDFILESEEEVPISFVRVVKTQESYINTDQLPYGGINHSIPGKIECEHYDVGDEGFAYQDDSMRHGDATFRPDDFVDVIAKSGASNGYVVSYTNEDEWLEYTIDAEDGYYDLTLFYYCGETPGELLLTLNGEVIESIRDMENLGWETRSSITIEELQVSGGKDMILRLEFVDGAGFEIDAIEFVKLEIPTTGVILSGCPNYTLEPGVVRTLQADVIPYNASDVSVTWSSSDTLVASVHTEGRVTALTEGMATIYVTTNDGNFVDSCVIHVKEKVIPVTGLTIGNCPSNILTTGDEIQLIANVAPDNATDKTVMWSSSDASVATVDDAGLVKAISQGSVTITATTNDGGYTRSCQIGVMSSGIPLIGISISDCPSDVLMVDSVHQLSAAITPANAGDLRVIWSSTNDDVATVNASGLVTAISEGTATIAVTTYDGNLTDQCIITIVPSTVNIFTIEEDNDPIKIYPNPVSNQLIIELPGTDKNRKIRILNSLGQLIYQEDARESQKSINIEMFNSGGFISVQIISGNQVSVFKIIVVR